MDRELTFGEKAVGLTFNPGNNPAVDDCKRAFAGIIDSLDALRNIAGIGDQARLASVAITEAQTAQMWAVKAITATNTPTVGGDTSAPTTAPTPHGDDGVEEAVAPEEAPGS